MAKRARLAFSASIVLGALACAPSTDAARVAAAPAARAALGRPVDGAYAALSEERRAAAARSHRERRALGWQVAERVLQGVALPHGGTAPRFVTWYDRADLLRLFGKLYDGLGKDGRRARDAFPDGAIAAAEAWNEGMVLTLPGWSAERLAEWVAASAPAARRTGLSGLSRTFYSPGAARHLLANYEAASRADLAPFPASAALVKTAWHRADFNFPFPVFRTGADALRAHLDAASWVADETTLAPADVVTMQNEAGDTYRLAALHVTTKEQSDWVWVSLWWSDRPDEDFGADRPAALAASPWASYKMCVVTAFDERAAVDVAAPDLAAALEVAAGASAPDSWCSNPYLEAGAGNQRTNCLGCHQHAGTALDPREIPRLPAGGRPRGRETFPADYLWSLTRDPERIGAGFLSWIRHYDVYDPLDL